jgi:hypothetical protein
MALLAGELAEIVWAETRALGSAPADGTGSVNSVRRLVALLAASTNGAGFERYEPVPSVQDRQLGDAARALMSIAENAKAATAPQSRLIIWQADGESLRLNNKTSPPPPAPWDNIAYDKIFHQLHQPLSNGQTVDVFSRPATTDSANDPAFVNALTGTGVPGGRAPVAEARSRTNAKPRLGFWLFVVAALLFIVAAVGSYGVGVGSRLTINLFSQTARIAPDATSPALDCALTTADKPTVLNTANWRTNSDKAKDCRSQFAAAQMAVATAQYPDAREAAKDGSRSGRKATWTEWFASQALAWSGSAASTVSLFVPFCLALVSLVLLFVAAGFGVTGRALGPIIDERNRMSLTLAQLAMWSIILLSGLLIFGLYNYGFGGLAIAELQQQAAATTAAGESPNSAKSAIDSYNLFPTIPYYLYMVAGFSVATPFVSRLISQTTMVGTPDQTSPDPAGATSAPRYLADKSSPADAALSDTILQEVKGRNDLIDVSRVQHVAITGILGISYLLVLFGVVSNIDAVRIVYAAAQDASVLSSMPQIDGTFTALLFVSHAALLGSKLYDKVMSAKRAD